MKNSIKLIRVYDLDESVKGKRFLIDRLWPRGISKESLKPFIWEKEIAPSNELRKWYGHDVEKFSEFKIRYFKELKNNSKSKDVLVRIKDSLKKEDVLLLFSAKDEKHNNAVVFKEWILNNL
ncbi:MAG: DUF488 family protein [Lagierella massiliensis]|nr:DUF488 family protein [Lagierella massiliensis]